MRIPIALHALTLATMAAGSSMAQDAKPEEAKPAETRAEVIRKLHIEPIGKPAEVQVFKYPETINTAIQGVNYLQSMGGGQNQAAVEWQNALQDWQRLSGRGLDGVGADLTPADDAVRSQLKLSEGQGLVVTGVIDGGPAARAGLKVNDILLILDEKPLAKAEDLLGHLKNCSLTHPEKTKLGLHLLRDGKPMTITVKPEVRVVLGSVAEPKPSYFIGTPANPIDETLRVHLGLPEGHGLIVSEAPEAGTPAAKAGIQKNDILLSFNGQLLKDVETLRSSIQAVGEKPAKVEVIRAGKPVTVSVTPEPRKGSQEFVTSLEQMVVSSQRQSGVQVIQDSPYLLRLDGANGQPQAILNPTAYAASADLSKKIDDLTAQVQALTKAVEELRKSARTGEGK
jgi:membrane-associated protease RseP (regulator of RpoE activity)